MDFSLKQYDSKQCYEVRIGHVYIGFSYSTPISLCDMNDGGGRFMTDKYYSRTTNQHKQLLLSKANYVSQDELEHEIEFALAKQAMRTLRERLNYESASTGSPDQSESGVGTGSSVLRELGTTAQAG